jgi:hypothetical protein
VSAREPILTVAVLSRRASVGKWPEHAPRTPEYVAKSAAPRLATRYSLWHLAGIEARAFSSRASTTKARLFRLRASMFFSLIVYEHRAHPSGGAVCLLRPHHGRFAAVTFALVLGIALMGVVSPLAGTALAAAVVALLLPRCAGSVRARTAERCLKRLTPPGQTVYLHSLASTLPGAGAELLRSVNREADAKGWSLVLDAADKKLIEYYRNFGFCALGRPVLMPDRSYRVRMWRPANDMEGPA